MNNSKREFLKGALVSVAGASVNGFGLNLMALANASAADMSTGYKALVCIYLDGGNDGFNTVIPWDVSEPGSIGLYDSYANSRKVGNSGRALKSLALDKPLATSPQVFNSAAHHDLVTGNSLPIRFFMHPALTKVQSLYQSGQAAVVANVGPLKQATSMTNFLRSTTFKLPPNLFSHSDQMEQWLRAQTNESGVVGWGGTIASLGPKPAGLDARSVFIGVQTSFSNSPTLAPNQAAGTTSLNLARGTSNGGLKFGAREGGDGLFGIAGARSLLMDLLTDGQASANKLESTYSALVLRSSTVSTQVEQMLAQSVVPDAPAGNQLADDLRLVAKTIKANANSTGRQVFYVSLPGFDTHNDQWVNQNLLLGKLDEAVAYFQNALGTELFNKVTTFTASEFGRKMVQNDNGTDHGWGSHHFVIGGAVSGGKFYGSFPDYRELGQGYLMPDGTMIPTIPINNYIWPMAEWLGVDKATVDQIFGFSTTTNLFGQSSSTPLMRRPAV
ncbi:MAG: DUF1501 domain-containing protein [Rubrivivax sp.]|nr:MAG: DUF1501 domain-containing protein [Rubrivivax sp.]